MGAIGGLLGTAGGQAGTGFSTPSGTNAGQLQQAYQGNQTAMQGQQGLLSALQAQNGLGNQSQVYNQLQGVVNGQGPNPAQAMLNQATAGNVANQAALQAGQRGAAQNVGLIARQAGQQGMQAQQQAAGQGASMQAQQALGAIGQAGGIANTQAANQIGQTNANTAAQQNEQSILQGANSQNNQIQGQLANTTMQGQQGLMGGILNAAGSAAGLANGGEVKGKPQGPQSNFAMSLFGSNPMPMATGGQVPAMVSPGELILTPDEAKMVADGRAKASQIGTKVPGKAAVKGDSYSNDNVPAKLPEGGVVVKRTKAQSDESSGKFVRDVLNKKRKKA